MKKILYYLQVVFYLFAGVNHFRNPGFYLGMIPPYLPAHETINLVAGVAEVVAGGLLFFSGTRKWGAYAIIVLLIAFIPAHVYFIQIGSCITDGICVPQWVGWLRLLLIHPLLIAWAWWCRK